MAQTSEWLVNRTPTREPPNSKRKRLSNLDVNLVSHVAISHAHQLLFSCSIQWTTNLSRHFADRIISNLAFSCSSIGSTYIPDTSHAVIISWSNQSNVHLPYSPVPSKNWNCLHHSAWGQKCYSAVVLPTEQFRFSADQRMHDKLPLALPSLVDWDYAVGLTTMVKH